MVYVLLIILVLLNLCLLALTLLALPGNWLVVGTTVLFAWWRPEALFSKYTLIGIALLAMTGEIIEFFAGMGGARRAGASWKSALGAIGGTIAGGIVGTFMIPIPILGTLLGACLGAGLISGFLERSAGRGHQAVRTGMGAGIGVFIGTTAKFVIGILIWLIITIAAFWP
ncbi:MAG: DUF456 domain-containing protein [Sedimentisphaerales bacterium]|nr:DUF456 domain-containing protein [Sedimentisphaerales bacterium]